MRSGTKVAGAAITLLLSLQLLVFSATAAPRQAGIWSVAQNVETGIPGTHASLNTGALEGCPFISPDGKSLYMASDRPGGFGGLDIWVSSRASVNDGWGEPVNLGEPVNSASNDFCPTIARDGHTLYFVSNRPGGCGGSDIYVSRSRPHGWDTPVNLGCALNSDADEFSPFPVNEAGSGPVLYFSSNRAGGFSAEVEGAVIGDFDLYISQFRGGIFGPAVLVPGVNTAADDSQPNLSRDDLEMYFFSTRPGGFGGPDLYVAARTKASRNWLTVANLGPHVNSAAGETRPSLSWNGKTLYFGSNRPGGEGSSDIYYSSR